MTAPDGAPDLVPDPEAARRAKQVHVAISILRLLGIAILMLGIAIALGRIAGLPAAVGYILVVLGLAQTWVVPFVMVRRFVRAEAQRRRDEAA